MVPVWRRSRGDRTRHRVPFAAPSPETELEPTGSFEPRSQRCDEVDPHIVSSRRAARAQPGTREGAYGPPVCDGIEGDRTRHRVLFAAPSPETGLAPPGSFEPRSHHCGEVEPHIVSGRRAARAQRGTREGAYGPRLRRDLGNPHAITSHLSPLTSHLSPLTSHLSPLTSHLSLNTEH